MNDPLKSAAVAADVLGPAMDGLGGPLGIVGRVAGLGADELDAGIPGWGWAGVGFVAGAIAMYFLHDRMKAFAEE